MLKVNIEPLLPKVIDAIGTDLVLTVKEQPLGDAVRWRAAFEGDKSLTGEGASPYEAISDYMGKIAGVKVAVEGPDGSTKDLTLAANGTSATVEHKGTKP